MNLSRRNFLKTTGLMASGLAMGSAPFLSACNGTKVSTPFGIQLYTLRDVIADDPRGILQQLAEFGYRQIESYEGPMGMFWGMENTEFNQFLNDHGMNLISSHANVFEDYERKVEQAAEIDMDYIVCPYIGQQDTLDDYREMADTFNRLGEIANNAGVKFAYHNHDYTFKHHDGVMPQDILMQETDPELVEFQVDIYWVEVTGESTIDWIRKYPGRFTSCHVKDLANGSDPESTILGTGNIDYASVLQVAKENGMQHHIVEQEAYTNTTPMDAARENAEFMRQLSI